MWEQEGPASPPALLIQSVTLQSERSFKRRRFLSGDRALDRRLHLLEGADLDLAHALPRYAELGREIFQRHRLVGEPPRLEDAAFSRVEHLDCTAQCLAAMIELLAIGHQRFLARRGIDQPVLPFARFAVLADR